MEELTNAHLQHWANPTNLISLLALLIHRSGIGIAFINYADPLQHKLAINLMDASATIDQAASNISATTNRMAYHGPPLWVDLVQANASTIIEAASLERATVIDFDGGWAHGLSQKIEELSRHVKRVTILKVEQHYECSGLDQFEVQRWLELWSQSRKLLDKKPDELIIGKICHPWHNLTAGAGHRLRIRYFPGLMVDIEPEESQHFRSSCSLFSRVFRETLVDTEDYHLFRLPRFELDKWVRFHDTGTCQRACPTDIPRILLANHEPNNALFRKAGKCLKCPKCNRGHFKCLCNGTIVQRATLLRLATSFLLTLGSALVDGIIKTRSLTLDRFSILMLFTLVRQLLDVLYMALSWSASYTYYTLRFGIKHLIPSTIICFKRPLLGNLLLALMFGCLDTAFIAKFPKPGQITWVTRTSYDRHLVVHLAMIYAALYAAVLLFRLSKSILGLSKPKSRASRAHRFGMSIIGLAVFVFMSTYIDHGNDYADNPQNHSPEYLELIVGLFVLKATCLITRRVMMC